MCARILSAFLVFIACTANAQLVFEQEQFFKTDIRPNFMELGDLDDDGRLDIMIASENERFITIMLKATKYTPTDIIIGESTALERGIIVADFDEDGIVDLAVTDLNANRVAVLLGTGNGRFAAPVYYAVGLGPIDIMSSDYDGDGDIDLVTANNMGGTVSILANAGDGTFVAALEKQVQDGPKTVEFNDVNGDVIMDIIAVNNVSNSVSVLYGDGEGDFEAQANFELGPAPTELQIADINSDSFKDIVVVHDGATFLSILYGSAQGYDVAVLENTDHTTSGGIFTIADLNEDSAPDIAICSKSTKELILLLGDGLGNFVESVVGSIGGSGYSQLHDVIASDVFETGHLNLMLTNKGSIHIIGMIGDGTGQFDGYNELHSSPSPYRLTVNDFNADGYPDVASANYYTNFISLYINDGQGRFTRPLNLEAPGSTFVTSADLDEDGFLDIIAGGYLKMNIFYGDATYKYDVVESYDFSEGGSITVADVNGDHHLDLATIIGVYLGDGNRQFLLSHSYTTPTSPSDATLCDLNSDGKLDWIMVYFDNDEIKMHPGNGDGTFGAPVNIAVGDGPSEITFGYFDDDADVDVAVTNALDGTISIIPGGTGTLSANSSIPITNFGLGKILGADMNGDGNGDILVANSYTPVLLVGDGDGTFTEQQLIGSANQLAMAAYDFDGNGGLDVLGVSNMLSGGIGGIAIHLSSIEPHAAATNLSFDAIGEKSVELSWNNGDGAERLVIARKTLPVGSLPDDNTYYEADIKFGDGSATGIGQYVVYKGSDNAVVVTGLIKGETYHFAVVEFNGTANLLNYNTADVLVGEVTTVVNEPGFPASGLTFSDDHGVSWISDNGDGRIVIAKAGSPVDEFPVDNVSYIPDSEFGGGDDLGGGNFVLYVGTGQEFTVMDLDPDIEYYYAVFEYSRNESGSIINYRTSSFASGRGRIIQTITFGAIEQKQYLTTTTFMLSATASSDLDVTYTSSDPLVATVVDNVVTIVGPGTTTITAEQEGDVDFLPATSVSQDLLVIRAEQHITFTEVGSKHIGDVFDLDVTSDAELDLELTSDNEIATISGKTVTLSGIGTVTITAKQIGNGWYLPAASVTRTFDVYKKPNEITFADIENKTLGFAPFDLVATATSEIPVAFSTPSDRISLSGATLTGIAAGRITIWATEAGNDIFEEAAPLERTFCINPAKPAITVTMVDGTPLLTSSNAAGNQWKLDGDDVDGTTANTLSASAAGSYTVVTTVDDCVSEESDAQVMIVTGLAHRETAVRVYPNPTTDFLQVEVASDVDESLDIVVTDMLGRVMATKAGRTNRVEAIDISHATGGNYVVRMVTSNATLVQKIVKR